MTPRQGSPRHKIIILHNPLAGRAGTRHVLTITRALTQRGCEVNRVIMADMPHLPTQIDDILKERPDVIAVAGGDGTINKIMPLLASSPVPMALLPFGTANVLATALNIPTKTGALVDYILHGNPQEMRYGIANGACFCCMVSVGFDAAVVGGVNLTLKKLISKGAYLLEALRALYTYRSQIFSVRADGRDLTAYGAIVTLTPFYAGHYVIAPKASPFAPAFALVLFNDKGVLSLLRYARALAWGKISSCRGVEIISAQEVDISTQGPAKAQADGDLLCELPLRLSKAGRAAILIPGP